MGESPLDEVESEAGLESEQYFHRSDRNDIDNPWGGMLVGGAIVVGLLVTLVWFLIPYYARILNGVRDAWPVIVLFLGAFHFGYREIRHIHFGDKVRHHTPFDGVIAVLLFLCMLAYIVVLGS